MVASRESSTESLAERFRRFAAGEASGRTGEASPLYAHLAQAVAGDEEMLALAAHAQPDQPAPNLLFAAVQYLLFSREDDPLAAYYASVTAGAARPVDDGTWPAFRAFVEAHAGDIRTLLETRRVQTNSVRRTACLLPAFESVSRRAGRRPLALVDLGASAGLNLLWPRFGFDYGDAGRCGDPDSPVQLRSDVVGRRPPLPEALPPVGERVGIELNPLDVRHDDDARWLTALVWPEHDARRRALRGAIRLAREDPPRLVKGDVVEEVARVAKSVPDNEALCLYNTHALYQMPDATRARLFDEVAAIGATRDVYWLSCEKSMDIATPVMHLFAFENGERHGALLARYNAHGAWIDWLGP